MRFGLKNVLLLIYLYIFIDGGFVSEKRFFFLQTSCTSPEEKTNLVR